MLPHPSDRAASVRCWSEACSWAGGGTGHQRPSSVDVTIKRLYGGYSSAAERLTVAQDVVGSIPTSRPIRKLFTLNKIERSAGRPGPCERAFEYSAANGTCEEPPSRLHRRFSSFSG